MKFDSLIDYIRFCGLMYKNISKKNESISCIKFYLNTSLLDLQVTTYFLHGTFYEKIYLEQ